MQNQERSGVCVEDNAKHKENTGRKSAQNELQAAIIVQIIE